MRPVIAVTAAALAATALTACVSRTMSGQAGQVPAPAPGTSRIGDTVTLTYPGYGLGQGKADIAVTLVKVVPSASSAEWGFSPSSGYQWVAVVMQVKDLGSVPYTGSPNQSVTAVDAAGQSVPAMEDAPTTAGPQFADGLALTKGNTSSGVITFQVPTGDKLITVQFDPSYGEGTGARKWTVG